MKVLLTLTDVEPAVRLNARLEAAGVETTLVSPLDDVRGGWRRSQPDVVVITGGLLDPGNLELARLQLWEGRAVVGLADVDDPLLRDRMRAMGVSEVYAKPVVLDEVYEGVRQLLERQRMAAETGLIGDSAPIREVLVRVAQMAPVSSTVPSGTARAPHSASRRASSVSEGTRWSSPIATTWVRSVTTPRRRRSPSRAGRSRGSMRTTS